MPTFTCEDRVSGNTSHMRNFSIRSSHQFYFHTRTGDMLGDLQSGIQRGRTVDLEYHWGLLDAATRFGRSFMQRPTENDGKEGRLSEESVVAEKEATAEDETASNTIVKWLAERNATAVYEKTSAASKQGLTLRIMMALFAEQKSDDSNIIEAISALQNLDASKGVQIQDAKTIHAKIVEAFFNPSPSDLGTQLGMKEPVPPLKPYLAALHTQVRR